MSDEKESLTEAVRRAGHEAANEAQKRAAAVNAARNKVLELSQDPMNVRLAAIDLAQRAAQGKQWTPEQYQAATEFYYEFITADRNP